MDKKEINSPKLSVNFLIWICGVGRSAAPDFLSSFRLENYMNHKISYPQLYPQKAMPYTTSAYLGIPRGCCKSL
jgi:hypothetical protein